MLTAADKKWIKNSQKDFVTKDYLRDYLDFRFRIFEQHLDEKFVTKDEFKTTMNKIFEYFDMIAGEIKAMRQDLAASLYRQQEHTSQLENHDLRLNKLEEAYTMAA